MVLGIPGGLAPVMSRESATLLVLKARLTSRTSDELHLVAQLSGLSRHVPFLLDFARRRGHARGLQEWTVDLPCGPPVW
jgi:hypothetical protein